MTKLQNITVLYFGSFNPFHIGHAAVAKFVASLPWVEELCFVLSPKNPIKESNTLQDANIRWEDLQRVVKKLNQEAQETAAQVVSGSNPVGVTQIGHCSISEETAEQTGSNHTEVVGSSPASATNFTASDIEFHLEPPLYTYNTLEELSKQFPDKHFALLMGGDNINILHKWYRGEELLQKYPILVYPREGVDTEALCKEKGAIFIDAPQVNVSSTQIRNMQASGEDVSHLRY